MVIAGNDDTFYVLLFTLVACVNGAVFTWPTLVACVNGA
eukprot:gene56068-52872_t